MGYSSVTPAEQYFTRKNSNKREGCSNLTVTAQKNGKKPVACVVSYNLPYMELGYEWP